MLEDNPYDQLASSFLTGCGLNMQAILPVEQLPSELRSNILAKVRGFRKGASLLLVGNGGSGFWNYLSKQSLQIDDPVDKLSIALVRDYIEQKWAGVRYQVLYPSDNVLDLQYLGRLAGWHHDSPLKLGINPTWGLWFAYRVLVLLDLELDATDRVASESPCLTCAAKPCVRACPANALEQGQLSLSACSQFRKIDTSLCKFTCLARLSCPVQVHHRYGDAQIQYHYGISLRCLP